MNNAENNRETLLKVAQVRHSYSAANGTERSFVLERINFELPKQQFCSIVGKSGCGKSTLLKIIAGLLQPTEGNVYLNGNLVTKPTDSVAVVFQDYSKSLLPWLNLRENIKLGLINKNLNEELKNKRVDDYLELVGLSANQDKFPWQLSGGMQQRVAIARALARHPELLLLDEPFGALDAFTRLQLEDEVRSLAKTLGFTTLMITHDIDEAVYISDRVLVLSNKGILEENSENPELENDIGICFPEDEINLLSNNRNQVITRKHNIYQDYRTKILKELDSEGFKKNMS